jgi:chromosome segregation ATPase
MTFISEALYNSLKKEQEALLGQIGNLTKESTDLANRVKNDEAFLASYDSTKDKLEASVANAEAQIPVLEKRIDDNKTLEAQSKADLEKQNEDLNKLKQDLEAAIKEGEPQSVIDSINASIVVVEGKISDLQKVIDNCKSQVASLNQQVEDTNNTIAVSKKELAENAAKKEDLEGGGLDQAKDSLAKVNTELSDVNATYSAFINANQATINAFEAQDERRNK